MQLNLVALLRTNSENGLNRREMTAAAPSESGIMDYGLGGGNMGPVLLTGGLGLAGIRCEVPVVVPLTPGSGGTTTGMLPELPATGTVGLVVGSSSGRGATGGGGKGEGCIGTEPPPAS